MNRLILLITMLWAGGYCEPSLDSLIDIGLRENPSLQALEQRSLSAERAVGASKDIPDPQISAGFFMQEVETRVGPQKGRVGLSQKLPTPGLFRAKTELSKAQLEIAKREIFVAQNQLISQLALLWEELYEVGRIIELTLESLNLLKSQQELLVTQYSTGTHGQSTLLKMEIEVIGLEDSLEVLHSSAAIMRDKFHELLNGMHLEKGFFPKESGSLRKLQSPLSYENNPTLQLIESKIALAEARQKVAEKRVAPQFTIKGDVIFTAESENDMVSAEESGKNAILLGAAMSVPLWNKANRADIESKQYAIESSRKEYEVQKLRLERRAKTLFKKLADTERRIALFENEYIPRAAQSLSLALEAYQQNQKSILEYLDAQQLVLSLSINLVKQKKKLQRELIELHTIQGWNRIRRDEK